MVQQERTIQSFSLPRRKIFLRVLFLRVELYGKREKEHKNPP
jgi:hypothetical protein